MNYKCPNLQLYKDSCALENKSPIHSITTGYGASTFHPFVNYGIFLFYQRITDTELVLKLDSVPPSEVKTLKNLFLNGEFSHIDMVSTEMNSSDFPKARSTLSTTNSSRKNSGKWSGTNTPTSIFF